MLRKMSAQRRFLRRPLFAAQRRLAGGKATRRSDLARLTASDVSHFESVLNASAHPSAVLSASAGEDLAAYNEDWMRKYRGASQLVLRPASTGEVSAILSHCYARRLAVSIQGGNTGLVGGGVAVFDEVTLCLSRLNRIVDFDEQSGIVTCESGCILQSVDAYLRESHGCIFPLDLGAKGSCHIGGNVSTNAGGLRLVRYGNLHGSVMGVEAVLADEAGTVVDLTTRHNVKDNTGFDLKQLLIGSEGALAVVTRVCVLCPPMPRAENVVFVAVRSFEDVLRVKQRVKRELSEIVSAIEFCDSASLALPLRYMSKQCHFPLTIEQCPSDFYMIIETHGSEETHDREKIDSLIEALFADDLIKDGVIAADRRQFEQLWTLREGVGPSISHGGLATYKYDISLPLTAMYAVVEECRSRVEAMYRGADGAEVTVVGYGHVGDGNLHLNVVLPAYNEVMEAILEPWIYERCAELKGSISAEHGIGQMKPNMLPLAKPAAAIEKMQAIKKLFDPRGILNPYKVLPF